MNMGIDNSSDHQPEKTCFVIMPISDTIGYDQGHFKRVYDFLIKPACIEAGFIPVRADDIKGTNAIVIDILKRILSSDMAICDLSSRNPNVLYELGVRQSFDLPVTFIKDERTERIFDIQGFRDTPYTSNLRVDEVGFAITAIADNIRETYENKGKDVNSIIELLGINKAVVKEPITLSGENSVLLDALNEIQEKINRLAQDKAQSVTYINNVQPIKKIDWDSDQLEMAYIDSLKVGQTVEHVKFGSGRIKQIDLSKAEKTAVIQFENIGEKTLLLSFAKLKTWKG